jgi:putative PIN family toxin of toxin-antitoxin system
MPGLPGLPGLRIVLDTNVLVSGLAYPGGVPGRIVAAWRQGSLEVALSRYLLDELARVLPRLPRVRLSAAEIRDLCDSFLFLADLVEPEETEDRKDPHLRDPADQAVLSTLLAGKARYLVTGDKDLLALAERYPIITPAAFWARHGG